MVKNTTIALTQSVVALLAILINAILQSIGLSELNKSLVNNVDVEDAKKLLFIAIMLQFVAAVLMITVLILLIVYREKLQQHMNKFIYVALIISGLLLLIGGSLGASVAVRLQCYRGDPNVDKAWQRASITSVIGIVGTIVLLLIQVFTQRETIKGAARDYLTHEYIRRPTHKPIQRPTHKVQMPNQKPVQMPNQKPVQMPNYKKPVQMPNYNNKAVMPAYHPPPYKRNPMSY